MPGKIAPSLLNLLHDIRNCTECEKDLPHGPRPVLAAHQNASILIIGQAPGRRVHESGIAWDDASGDRLRDWLGVSKDAFYDESRFAIVPMGFCYPGTGNSGDLPPRPECARLWHARLLSELKAVKLRLLVGSYAQKYGLGDDRESSLTATVRNWKKFTPTNLPLPHPSPRNNIWMKKNPWFTDEVLPYLRRRVKRLLR